MWRVIVLSILASGISVKSDPEPRADDLPHRTIKCEDGERWGIVDVRPDAHLFYWLYLTTHEDGYMNRPVVIWLPGGPGGSASGSSNFGSIGPLDLSLKPRNTTWVQTASVLFIDTPVGAGFSWCDNDEAFNTDMAGVTRDISVMMRAFLADNPEFQELEFYIFGLSYGGKMAPSVTRQLYEDAQNGELQMTIKGTGMGCPLIYSLDIAYAYGEFLYWSSAIDEAGRDAINAVARTVEEAILEDDWQRAMRNWEATLLMVLARTNLINLYYMLRYFSLDEVPSPGKFDDGSYQFDRILEPKEPMDLDELMNGPIREKLGIIPEDVIFGAQFSPLYANLRGDFMKPVLEDVDWLLINTDVQVATFQGQLDLILNTKGQLDWIQRLTWSGLPDYNAATRKAFVDPNDGQTDMYVKAYQKFKFYWMLRAGHGITNDMAETSLRMLNRILDDLDN